MQAFRKAVVSVLLVSGGAIASAQGLGRGLSFGMPGIGLQPETLVTERFGIRGAFSSGGLSYQNDEPVTRFDGKFPFGTGFLLADWHPYANGFRVSGGLAFNNQPFDGSGPLSARLGGSAMSISSTRFSMAPVGSLDTRARYARATPYVGVGWGLTPSPGSRLYFSADLGVMYQRPSAGFSAHCSAALSASRCAQLQGDLRAEETEYREATDDFRFYPVISVGFGLRF